MARLAFMQFYPNDWLAEPSLRACSLAARGLWIDLLSLMHLSPRRGYLLSASGNPLTPPQIARLTGCDAEEASRLIAELQSSGCFNCTDDGTIYSRRMVRDEGKRQACSEAGKKGGGNPTFKGHPKGDPKGGPKGGPKLPETRDQKPEQEPSNPPPPQTPPDVTAKPKPKRERQPPQRPESVPIPASLDTTEFRSVWADWLADRKSRGKPVTELAAKLQLADCESWGLNDAIASIRKAIASRWQGLFRQSAGNARSPPPPSSQRDRHWDMFASTVESAKKGLAAQTESEPEPIEDAEVIS
jgi:hypothetical protein